MKSPFILATAGALGLLLCVGGTSALAAPWQFGIISDTQWVSSAKVGTATWTDDGWNPDSTAAAIIHAINVEMINKNIPLVVNVGDQMDSGSHSSYETRALYSQELYNHGIAYYSLRGNHDAGLVGSGSDQAFCFPQIVNGGVNNTLLPFTQFSIAPTTGYTPTGDYLNDFINNPVPVTNGVTFVTGSNFSYAPTNGLGTSPSGWTINSGGVVGNYNFSTQYGAWTSGTTLAGKALGNGGLSYSFDYNNFRFMMIDQFVDTDAGGNTSAVSIMQPWITQQLSAANRPIHAMTFSHKNILGGNHKDNLFGANVSNDPGDGYGTSVTGSNLAMLTQKKAAEDAFITSLVQNNIRYAIGGHDHHHKHSVCKSPNSANSIHELITQSASSKFYTPASPYSANETSISEDLWEVGYYVVTVDGPRITMDYFAVPSNTIAANGTSSTGQFATGTYGTAETPVLSGNWVKMQTWGYSLNGTETLVAQGSSYGISDNTTNASTNAATYGDSAAFVGSSMTLSGTNKSAAKTHDGRALTKAVDTGWAPANGAISDILTLWGMTDLAAIQTDTVCISITVPSQAGALANDMSVCLGCQDPKSGTWINAVDDNIVGGSKTFVARAYIPGDGLGTWGIDQVHGTAWAVVNGNARNFAIISTPSAPLPWAFAGVASHVGTADYNILNAAIRANSKNPIYDLDGDGKVTSADARWLSQHFTNVGGK